MKDKLIVIEGACDGIGKTTQVDLLIKHLKKDCENVINYHFPSYNTYQGLPVEKYLKGEFGNKSSLSNYFINSLFAHDRAVTWYTYLKKEYENDKTIILDRYTTSSIIYQSAFIDDIDEKKKFIDYVMDYEYNKLGIKKPDKVIFLYAPFEVINDLRNKRKNNEGVSNDIHESDINFLKKVYDNAVFISKYLSWNVIDCTSNGKMKNMDEIHNEIYKIITR